MMRSKFDEQLDRLNKEMMKMGSAIEDSIRKAVDALVKQDAELAKKVMLQDEEIDREQKTIESICFNLHHFFIKSVKLFVKFTSHHPNLPVI